MILQYVFMALPAIILLVLCVVLYINGQDWRRRAESLWDLLDHIDTLDDSARSDNAYFRVAARGVLAKRHSVMKSYDGQSLTRE